MSRRIYVTGMGIITSIGMNVDEHFDSLIGLRSGFGKIELLPTVHKDTLPAFEIKITDAELCRMAAVPVGGGFSRTALLGIIAVKEALDSADISNIKEARTGLISSTTVGGMREFEANYKELIDTTKDGTFMQYAHVVDTGEHSERIADHFGIRDYVNTVSTACSSASNAIILGAELIKHGKLDRVICGGSDVLARFTLNGFNSLMILDKGHCKPFDANRAGVNLGEGAAYIVLESEEMIQKRPKKIWAELTGYSNSNDAYHQTASSPDGDGAMLSMQRALDMAGMKTSDIDYINCHGTATENNDLSEALAIQKLFGEHVPSFASTKPYTGHTLAAAGGVEAIFSLLSIDRNIAFPNLNFETQMPEITITPLRTLTKDVSIKNILSNSFGFGGSNTSLLFSKIEGKA
jgi:3-oxoacyl-(acyl-carrier-protein) synthase